jgi:hypothetical protein
MIQLYSKTIVILPMPSNIGDHSLFENHHAAILSFFISSFTLYRL